MNGTLTFCLTSFSCFFPFLPSLGPLLPKALSGLSMVTINEEAFAFGGLDSNRHYNREIYKLSCKNRSCMWTIMDMELKVPRSHFVAIAVSNSYCTWKNRNTLNILGSIHIWRQILGCTVNDYRNSKLGKIWENLLRICI